MKYLTNKIREDLRFSRQRLSEMAVFCKRAPCSLKILTDVSEELNTSVMTGIEKVFLVRRRVLILVVFRRALRPDDPPVQCVPGSFLGCKE